MRLRDFLKAGHPPTLLCAFGYFDVSFMVWMLLAPLAPCAAREYGWDPKGADAARLGLLVAVPLVAGAILRVVFGLLTDRIGPRRTGLFGLTLTLVPLLLGWLWAHDYPSLVVVGLLLGVPGASFAAALPLASRWYPPKYQGLALGIAGAGNSGTVLATLFAPLLAGWLGDWHLVFALALVPVAGMLALFAVFAKDSPAQPAPRSLADYAAVLGRRECWWFCLFYAVTFGGFAGLASFLNTFFQVQYGLGATEAGYFAAGCVVTGSLLRPVGGWIADRLGGVRVLTALYVAASAVFLGLTTLPPLAVAGGVLVVGMGLLGMGNGAVFQLVPQRFPREVGVITGLVGAAGGLGGSLLPVLLGSLKQLTATYALGFPLFALAALSCAALLPWVARSWLGRAASSLPIFRAPDPIAP
jgi:MFS transporter, NNP family, nitrate/nitrite transporter